MMGWESGTRLLFLLALICPNLKRAFPAKLPEKSWVGGVNHPETDVQKLQLLTYNALREVHT